MTKLHLNLNLGSVSDKGAERCFRGGVAAGAIATSLENARRAVEYPEKADRFRVEEHLRTASRHVRDLRKMIPKGRENMIALEAKLKDWSKTLGESFMEITGTTKDRFMADLKEMRKLVRGAAQSGLRQCGRKFTVSESDAADAIHDSQFYLDQKPKTPPAEPSPGPSVGRRRLR